MRLVCWQPLLTDHQGYTYGALAKRVKNLRVNIWRTEDTVRAVQGWTRRSPTAGEEHCVPTSGWFGWARDVLRSEVDAVHLFGSPFEDPRQIAVMLMACFAGNRVALMSEPYSISASGYFAATAGWKDRLKQRLRPLRYGIYGALIGKRVETVFAISPLACQQYAEMGVPADRIAPFGYFVPGPDAALPPREAAPALRLVFVGSLIERKGLRIAVDAVKRARAQGQDVTLAIYGPGDPAGWEDAPAIVYLGILPFGAVAPTLACYDALVLPSLFDGWGVVANEAIQAAVPVIASDTVGAAAMVVAQGCGAVFRAGDAEDLARIIRAWREDPERLVAATRAATRAAPLLDPEVAADYIVEVLAARAGAAALPASPWYPDPLRFGA